MNPEPQKAVVDPDSAAVFAIALSLWETCRERCREEHSNLSECYHGWDQLMREVMRIACQFEIWACEHVDFDEFDEVWPYYMGDNFGAACVEVLSIDSLMDFGEADCLKVAAILHLPVICAGNLPVPIDLIAANPGTAGGFWKFRIQTTRDALRNHRPTPYVVGDDPFDENFTDVYVSLYGIDSIGTLEHIANRKSYAEVLELARKLAPGVAFPASPTFRSGRRR